ncbi:MAG: hypothetical protein AB8H03_07975 [Saprospiraceae bacterium]
MEQQIEEHLPKYRVRPRFQVATSFTLEQLVEKIKISLAKENTPCKGWIHISGHGKLLIPRKHQHYWSPQLSLTIEAVEEGSLLRGLYGPRESVWTLFMFFYFLIAFATVIISIIGLSNLYLGKPGLVLWLVPILILIFLTLFLVAFFGQKLGHDEMVTLHHFLEDATGLIIDEEHQVEVKK